MLFPNAVCQGSASDSCSTIPKTTASARIAGARHIALERWSERVRVRCNKVSCLSRATRTTVFHHHANVFYFTFSSLKKTEPYVCVHAAWTACERMRQKDGRACCTAWFPRRTTQVPGRSLAGPQANMSRNCSCEQRRYNKQGPRSTCRTQNHS